MIQGENDAGDIAEARDGIANALALGEEARHELNERVWIATEQERTGVNFISEVLIPLLSLKHPDLVIIDPVLSYFGRDVKDQEAVTNWLRHHLHPALHRAQCGCLLVCHTPKPPREASSDWTVFDMAYSAIGSSEWANFARAVLVLQSSRKLPPGMFGLHLGKRGQRAGWRDASGRVLWSKLIQHGDGGNISWREVPAGAEDMNAGDLLPDDDILAIFPASVEDDPRKSLLGRREIRATIKRRGWTRDVVECRIETLVRLGTLAVAHAERNAILHGRPEVVTAFNERRNSRKQAAPEAAEIPKAKV
jgi:hypothetical protein